jgi:hypothetical protein
VYLVGEGATFCTNLTTTPHRRIALTGHGAKNFAITDADCICTLGPFAHLAGYKAAWVTGLVTGDGLLARLPAVHTLSITWRSGGPTW